MRSIYVIHLNGADTATHNLHEALTLLFDLRDECDAWEVTISHRRVAGDDSLVSIADRNAAERAA